MCNVLFSLRMGVCLFICFYFENFVQLTDCAVKNRFKAHLFYNLNIQKKKLSQDGKRFKHNNKIW